jgi:hypothetical protein
MSRLACQAYRIVDSGAVWFFFTLENSRKLWQAAWHGKQGRTKTRSKKAQEKNSEACSSETRRAPDRDARRINGN